MYKSFIAFWVLTVSLVSTNSFASLFCDSKGRLKNSIGSILLDRNFGSTEDPRGACTNWLQHYSNGSFYCDLDGAIKSETGALMTNIDDSHTLNSKRLPEDCSAELKLFSKGSFFCSQDGSIVNFNNEVVVPAKSRSVLSRSNCAQDLDLFFN